jgi:hypothetical protein
VVTEYLWRETIKVKSADGQEKWIPNPELPLKLAEGREIKEGYFLRDLENRIVLQVPMEQGQYKMERVFLKSDPEGRYAYTTCDKSGDHDPKFNAPGRVCRFKLDGHNQGWEDVFHVQEKYSDPFSLQDLDVNTQGDVVVVDRGHRMSTSLWKYGGGTKKVEKVTRSPMNQNIRGPRISSDGRWVTFLQEGELFLVRVKGAMP